MTFIKNKLILECIGLELEQTVFKVSLFYAMNFQFFFLMFNAVGKIARFTRLVVSETDF